MSALFFGELIYQYLCEKLEVLILIGVIASIVGAIFFKKVCKSRINMLLFVIVLFLVSYFIGIYRCTAMKCEISNIKNGLTEGQKVTLKGKIYKIEKEGTGNKIYLEKCMAFDNKISIHFSKTMIHLKDSESEDELKLRIGNEITLKAQYESLALPTNDGGFNEKEYYYSIGIFTKFQSSSDHVKIIDPNQYSYIKNTLAIIKEHTGERIDSLCGKKYAAIYKGMILGDKGDIDERTNTLYKLAGIAHLLAISGLHISAVGMFVFKMLRKRLGYYSSGIMSINIVFLYGVMTGNSISTRRAVIMFMINLIAVMFGRTYDIITSMSFAYLIMTMDNPYVIHNSGFILSFGAILSLILLYDTLVRFLRIKKKFLKALISGISVNVCTRPVIVQYYYEFPLYSSIVNMIVIPLSGMVLAFGFLGIFVSCINMFLGRIIISCGCIILKLYEYITELVIRLPFANIIVGIYSYKRMLIYYVVLILFIVVMKVRLFYEMQKKKQHENEDIEFYYVRYSKRVGCFIMIAVFLLLSLYRQRPERTVKIIDVGQGDSIFIQNNNGKTFLIDAGSSSKSKICKYCILPFLKSNGIRQIDYLIMTHSDQDHVNGMLDLLNYEVNGQNYVKNFVMPDINNTLVDEQYKELFECAAKNKIQIIKATDGLNIGTGNLRLKCINPLSGISYSDKNDCCLTFILEINDFRMLLTGDISQTTEDLLIRNQRISKVDVLKVAHHGSNASSSTALLEVARPEIAAISCGLHNRYGHPGKHTIERLERIHAGIYYTMKSGQISIYIKKKGFVVETFMN